MCTAQRRADQLCATGRLCKALGLRGDELQYLSSPTHLRVAVVQHLVQQLVDQHKVALHMVENRAGRFGRQ